MIPQQQPMARWKQSHAMSAPVGASAKRGTADTEAAATKRPPALSSPTVVNRFHRYMYKY